MSLRATAQADELCARKSGTTPAKSPSGQWEWEWEQLDGQLYAKLKKNKQVKKRQKEARMDRVVVCILSSHGLAVEWTDIIPFTLQLLVPGGSSLAPSAKIRKVSQHDWKVFRAASKCGGSLHIWSRTWPKRPAKPKLLHNNRMSTKMSPLKAYINFFSHNPVCLVLFFLAHTV